MNKTERTIDHVEIRAMKDVLLERCIPYIKVYRNWDEKKFELEVNFRSIDGMTRECLKDLTKYANRVFDFVEYINGLELEEVPCNLTGEERTRYYFTCIDMYNDILDYYGL